MAVEKFWLILILVIIKPLIIIPQGISYSCRLNKSQKVGIKVSPVTSLIENQNVKVKVLHYKINISNKETKAFSLYIYENRLHIIESGSSKINPTKDPVVFSKPNLDIYSVNVSDVFNNAHLVLVNQSKINDHSFYKYEVNTSLQQNFISEIIFDGDLQLDELKMNIQGAECRCTKTNITIPLRQK